MPPIKAIFKLRSRTEDLAKYANCIGSTKAAFAAIGASRHKYPVVAIRGADIINYEKFTPLGIVSYRMENSISLVCSWTYLSLAALMSS